MKTRKILSFVLAVLCVMGAMSLASCGSKNYAENNTEFTIGVSGPLNGDNAVYGLAVQNSAQLAIDEINAAGGLNGIRFKLVALDDKADPANVKTTYNALIKAGVQATLGTVTTGAGLEFTDLSVKQNMFFLTPSATGDDIPANANGYQMCFADSNQGTEAAKYVNGLFKDQGVTIGVLYKSDDAYSTGILNKFKEELDSSIGLTEASFAGESVTSFASQIQSLKSCNFIFMPIYYTPASQFIKEAKDTISHDAVYYGCDGLDGIKNVENFDVNAIPQEISFLSHFNSEATEGPAAEFITKYTAKYGTTTLNQFGASAYDCVYAIYGAMKKAVDSGKEIPVTVSPTELCEILKEQFNGDYTFTGITGEYKDGVQSSISWDSDGYVKKTAMKFIVNPNRVK